MVNTSQADNHLETAAIDARTCELLLGNYREVPSSVCFHAEQCAEKLLKQVYVDNGDVPPRSHDLTVILKETYELGYLSRDARLSKAAMFLQMFPTKARYVPFEDAECGEALTAVIHCNRLTEALVEQGYEGVTIKTSAKFLSEVEREGAEPGIPSHGIESVRGMADIPIACQRLDDITRGNDRNRTSEDIER